MAKGEFSEDRREPMHRVDMQAEFVVASAEILHEGVPCADHSRRVQLFQVRASAAAEPSIGCDRLRWDC
jgi:hypothetical protein